MNYYSKRDPGFPVRLRNSAACAAGRRWPLGAARLRRRAGNPCGSRV